MRNIIFIAVSTLFFYGCSNSPKKADVTNEEENVTAIQLESSNVSTIHEEVIAEVKVINTISDTNENIEKKKEVLKVPISENVAVVQKTIKEEVQVVVNTNEENLKVEIKDIGKNVNEVTSEISEVIKTEEPIKVAQKVDERTRSFVKKKNSIKGNWSLKQEGDKVYIVFHSNFKTKKGPDLKIFLTKQKIEAVTAKNALQESLFINKLKSNSGEQRYLIPSNIKVSQYKTMIIHCEEYTILWGGGSI